MAASSSSTNEVVTTDHNKSSQEPLKCPRCDSSNTKFCYYNNYSSSQPRHFCKACKRYWTRGGTLRNVPVGGGCRRHKRSVVKRQSPPPSSSSAATVKPTADPPPQNPSHAYNNNPLLFYSQLPTNNPDNLDDEVSFPFSRFSSTTRVSTSDDYHQHQMNGFGLGFPSGFQNSTGDYENRSIFFGSASSSLAPTSTVASFLDSKLQNQRFGVGGYEDIQMPTENGSGRNNPNQIHDDEQIIINDSSSHFSSLLWSTNNNAAAAADNNWFDP